VNDDVDNTERLAGIAESSLRGGSSLVASVGVSTVINGAGSIILARLLGPSYYAAYGLALALTLLLTHFATLGIDTAIVRYIPKLREEGRTEDALGVFRTGVVLRVTVALAFSVGAYLSSDRFAAVVLARPELGQLVRLASLAIFFEAIFWLAFYALQGLESPGMGGVVKLVQVIVKVVLAVLLILYGLGIVGALAGYIAGFVVSAVVGAVILAQRARSLSVDGNVPISWRYARLILGFGTPLYAVTVATGLVPQFRLIVLSLFVPDTEIGNFIAALNVTTLLSGMSFGIVWALLPAFSRLSAVTSREEYGRGFALAQRYAVLIVVPSALAFIALAPEIVYVLYCSQYTLAALYLALLSTSFLLVGIGNGILESFFNGMGEVWLTVTLWGLNLGAFVVLSIPFTMAGGTVGIIVADVASKSFACAVLILYARLRVNLSVDVSSSVRLYLSGLIAALLTILARTVFPLGRLSFLVVGGLLFLSAYVTLVPLTGAIDRNDIVRLEQAFRPFPVVGPLTRLLLRYIGALLRERHADSVPPDTT